MEDWRGENGNAANGCGPREEWAWVDQEGPWCLEGPFSLHSKCIYFPLFPAHIVSIRGFAFLALLT